MVSMLFASRAKSRVRAFRVASLCVSLLLGVQPLDAVEVAPAKPKTCGQRIQGEAARRVGAELELGRTVIVMRHAQAIDDKDMALAKPADCEEPERYVNSAGKDQLDNILRVLNAQSPLKFRVLFSPMCRTEQTARYLFSSSRTDRDDRLQSGAAKRSLADFLSSCVSEENLVLVTHAANVADPTGLRPVDISEAMAVVFSKAEGTPTALGECLGYLLPEDWSGLFSGEQPPQAAPVGSQSKAPMAR